MTLHVNDVTYDIMYECQLSETHGLITNGIFSRTKFALQHKASLSSASFQWLALLQVEEHVTKHHLRASSDCQMTCTRIEALGFIQLIFSTQIGLLGYKKLLAHLASSAHSLASLTRRVKYWKFSVTSPQLPHLTYQHTVS